MTDTTRDLLISLASHMAYMQGQLEAHHEYDDPEDYYWYRESVLLRQKVTDVLAEADEPAVPEGREPAAVTGQPNWRGLCAELVDAWLKGDDIVSAMNRARAVLARWGNLKVSLTSSPPADGEVAELVTALRGIAYWKRYGKPGATPVLFDIRQADRLDRAAELLQVLLLPVSVSERPWERDGWCDADWRCWWGRGESDDWSADWTLATPEAVAEFCEFSPQTVCLPFHALPLPEVNND